MIFQNFSLQRFIYRPMAALLLLVGLLNVPGPAQAAITIFAAASLQPALDSLAARYARQFPADDASNQLIINYASSGTLARQIIAGAEADFFISANPQWLAAVAAKGLVSSQDTAFLGNRLAVVRRSETTTAPITAADIALLVATPYQADWPKRLSKGRLAIGAPGHVPAGLYAEQALQQLGLWQDFANRLAETANVRAALTMALRGDAVAAIVYASDAIAVANLDLVTLLPEASHSPIYYGLATIRKAGENNQKQQMARQRLHDFLYAAEQDMLFQQFGFSIPDNRQ